MDLTERANATREVRDFTVTDLEIRDDDETAPIFEGVASVVDTPYVVYDMFGEFTETIVKGAFRKTLKERDDVRLLVNHEGVPLARTKSKTLKLTAAPDLRAEATLDPSNPSVQELRSAMSRGDLDQMSIAMRVMRQEWNEDYTDRKVLEAKLFDVSAVTFPASETTAASMRSLDEAVKALTAGRDIDPDMLRRAITHLESLVPVEEVPDLSVVLAERELRERLLTEAAFALK